METEEIYWYPIPGYYVEDYLLEERLDVISSEISEDKKERNIDEIVFKVVNNSIYYLERYPYYYYDDDDKKDLLGTLLPASFLCIYIMFVLFLVLPPVVAVIVIIIICKKRIFKFFSDHCGCKCKCERSSSGSRSYNYNSRYIYPNEVESLSERVVSSLPPQDMLTFETREGKMYYCLSCPLCKESFPLNYKKKLEAYV
jgi:hypothetical protein